MDDARARFRQLDGARVAVALLRAADQTGDPVRRTGVLHLGARGAPAIARIVDADDVPIVTLLAGDTCTAAGAAFRWELRPAFRIDVCALDDAPPPIDHAAIDVAHAMRGLAAELEAGFRSALLVRPDPAPEASVRARYGVPPIEDGPLADGSIRFAVDHASATLHADDDAALRLTCIASSIRSNRQSAVAYEPLRGPRYALAAAELEQLGADVRAFFAQRRERFVLAKRD